MRRLGLFGGSFDPPHLGHRLVAQHALEQLQLDSLLWMPARQSPFKTGHAYEDDAHRLAMVRRAAEGEPRFEASTLELQRPAPSYTVETLSALARLHPGASLFLLIGSDSTAGFPRWKSSATILDLANVAVYPRPAYPVQMGSLPAIRINAPVSTISSTDIRDRLRTGRSVREQVSASVHAYILEHRLYLH